MVDEPDLKQCDCDTPCRIRGEKKCFNCGGILDFESDPLYKINPDGSLTEL